MFKQYEMELGGRKLVLEFGKYAEQANGSTFVRYGDTVLLVTATASDKPRDGIDFFPLSVDFEEKLYSVGKIPGGFIKREGRPSEKAILTSRLIDRPLRPLFPKGMRNDVQVVAVAMSVGHQQRAGNPGHDWLLRRAVRFRYSFCRPHWRGQHRPDRWRVHRQPERRTARGQRIGPHRGGHQGRRDDGGSRREGSFRRSDAQGDPLRA